VAFASLDGTPQSAFQKLELVEREKSFFLKELFSVKEERSELRHAGERALLDSPSSK